MELGFSTGPLTILYPFFDNVLEHGGLPHENLDLGLGLCTGTLTRIWTPPCQIRLMTSPSPYFKVRAIKSNFWTQAVTKILLPFD